MTKIDFEERIEFEGEDFVIADIKNLLPIHRNFPHGSYDITKPWNGKPAVTGQYHHVSNREIKKLYCHQTAGSVSSSGFTAPIKTTNFILNDPSWVKKGDKWVWDGLGRGWPGCPYTYYIPYNPISIRNKVVIFKCWDNDWITWHSGDNMDSISIVCQGYFRSRHIKCFTPKVGCTSGDPSSLQIIALIGFIRQYAIGHLKIDRSSICGHYESPKPKLTCPGDAIEKIIKEIKCGKSISLADYSAPIISPHDDIELDTWEERQAALVFLKHNIGHTGRLQNGVDGDPGYLTRAAIECQEGIFGMNADGMWDDAFDYEIKELLFKTGCTYEDIRVLIPPYQP
jgi:hypothetical protein